MHTSETPLATSEDQKEDTSIPEDEQLIPELVADKYLPGALSPKLRGIWHKPYDSD